MLSAIHGNHVRAMGRIAFALIATSSYIGCGSDSEGPADQDSMSLHGANQAPVVRQVVLRPAQPVPGREVQARASVVDPDGDPTTIEYRWQTARGRLLGSGTSLDTSGLAPGSRLVVVATASDGRTESASFTHQFRLSQPSQAIGHVVIDASEGAKPGAVFESVVELLSADSYGASAELQWLVNDKVVGKGERLETGRFQPGDVVVLRARISTEAGGGRYISSQAVVLTRGEAPTISSQPLSGIESGVFRYQIRAQSDEPNADLSYGLVSGPEGMTVDEGRGLVIWRPSEAQRGRFEVEVSATDQWGTGIAQSFVIVADAHAGSPASPR